MTIRPPDSIADDRPSGIPDRTAPVRDAVDASGDGAFARVSETFERLRGLSPESRRGELEALSPALADELRELLRHHDAADTLLDSTLIRPGAPSRIGPYRLVQPLGEGGMGTVWLAEQDEPVRRRVAVKFIKLGMDTRQVLRRFQAERQVLARMEHPGIASVLDAGVTPDGRPYFVMELVRGERITDWADRRKLSTIDRLRLFRQVCAAVQHAHGKGVIHRDLKPSNILVTEIDGVPIPKVIDFGVAKVLDDPRGDDAGSERTNWTRAGQAIGTPDYMSPEQAGAVVGATSSSGAAGADVDIRSDVWSLGIVLFELLTGTTPTKARTRGSSGSGTPSRGAVVAGDMTAPRPSSVVGSRRRHAETAEHRRCALNRAAEPASLRRLLRAELDWIVLRALELDPARRYGTVAALADDIARFLENRPLAARPPGALYEARKFAGRHVVGITASVLVLLSLMIGLATALYGLDRARTDRDTAIAAQMRESMLADRLREELATNMIERGRLAGYAGNVALASSLLWDAYLDSPSSSGARWALREMLMRHPLRMSADYPGDTPYDGAMLAADGLLVVGSGLPPVVIDPETGRVLRTFVGATGEMRSVDLSPNGEFAVTGEREGAVRLWSIAEGREIASLMTRDDGLVVARFVDDRQVVCGDAAGSIHFIPLDDPAGAARIDTDLGPIEQLDVHRPTGRLAVGSRRGEVALIDAPDAAPRSLVSHDGIVLSLRFSPDGEQLASGATDRVVHLSSVREANRTQAIEPRNGSIRDLRYADDGRSLFVLGWWRLDRFDTTTGALRELVAEGGWRLVPHPAGDRATIVGRNRVHIRAWQLDPKTLLERHDLGSSWTVRHLGAACGSLAVGYNGGRAAGFGQHGRTRWAVDLGDTGVTAVAIAPEGDRLAVGGADRRVRIVALDEADVSGFRSSTIIAEFNGYEAGQNRAIAFVDRDTLVFPTDGNELTEIDLVGGARRTLLTSSSSDLPTGPISAETVTTRSETPARTLQLERGRELLMCAVSPDRRLIAVTQRHHLIHLIDRLTGTVRTVELETTNFSLAFTSDGCHLISGSWTGAVTIFDVETLAQRRSQPHSALVPNVAVHPTDPNLFASISSDGSARIWSVAECRSVFWLSPLVVDTGPTPLVAVGFDVTGERIIAAGVDGSVVSWPIGLADPFIEGNREFERQARR